MLVSLALVTVYFRESDGGALHGVQSLGASVAAPVRGRRRAGRARRSATPTAGSTASSTRKSENEKLQEGDRAARAAGDPQRVGAQENAQLQGAARLPGRPAFPQDYTPVAARVIARPPTAFDQTDRRRRRARRRASRSTTPVVTADGLVGQVTKVASNVAQVTLLTDETSAVSRARPRRRRGRDRPARPSIRRLARPRPRLEGRARERRRRDHHRRLALGRARLALPARDPDRHGRRASASPTPTSTSRSGRSRSSTSRRSRRWSSSSRSRTSAVVTARRAQGRRARLRRGAPPGLDLLDRRRSSAGRPTCSSSRVISIALLRGPVVGAVAGFWGGLLARHRDPRDARRHLAAAHRSPATGSAATARRPAATARTRRSCSVARRSRSSYALGFARASASCSARRSPRGRALSSTLLPTLALNLILTWPVYALCAAVPAADHPPRPGGRGVHALASDPSAGPPGASSRPTRGSRSRTASRRSWRSASRSSASSRSPSSRVLFLRLWALQVLSGDEYLSAAQNNQLRTLRVEAPRGPILDRDGRTLVTNVPGHGGAALAGRPAEAGRYAEMKQLSHGR